MLPCPVRLLRTRKVARSSPAQRMTRSSPSFFTRTTISSISMRAIRLRVAVSRPFGMPGGLDVRAEPQQRVPFGLTHAARLRGPEGEFLSADAPLSGVPSGQRRFETGLLQRQFHAAALGEVFAPARFQGSQRRLDAERLDVVRSPLRRPSRLRVGYTRSRLHKEMQRRVPWFKYAT